MSIKVRFMANTRDLIGKEEIELQMDGVTESTARDVLMAVAEAENRDLTGLLRAGGSGSWSAVRVVRNGRVLHSLDALVTDGDVLVLLPLLGAG
jgi:molybdopterin converting factor small subunit